MALVAITDGVTVKTDSHAGPYRRETCILSTQGRTSLTKREALKLGKILVAYGERES